MIPFLRIMIPFLRSDFWLLGGQGLSVMGSFSASSYSYFVPMKPGSRLLHAEPLPLQHLGEVFLHEIRLPWAGPCSEAKMSAINSEEEFV